MEDIDIEYTSYVPDDVLDELDYKLKKVLQYFPELWENTIKIGYTSTNIGKYISSKGDDNVSYLRLYKGVSLHTIAHELMHSVQYMVDDIPLGERPCELWTLAREPSILDKPPMSYLSVPYKIKDDWNRWKIDVHQIADKAIQERKEGRRYYITWFEDKLKEL